MEFILSLLGAIIGTVLGGYILFVGRRALQVTLAIIGVGTTANLLAVLVLDLNDGWDLFAEQAWILLGIAAALGIVGFIIGRSKPDLAALIIGFVAGADISLWFYDISTYVMTSVANQSEDVSLGTGLIVLVIGGLLGLWLIRVSRDEALILITMVLGVKMIQGALGFNPTSSLTAVIILTLALAGILVQYTLYLREVKDAETVPTPQASSLAFFQDLEL